MKEEHCGEQQQKQIITAPHSFGFICLVLEVSFLRMGKGRKLETDPPTPESYSLSTNSIRVHNNSPALQILRETEMTVKSCSEKGWRDVWLLSSVLNNTFEQQF